MWMGPTRGRTVGSSSPIGLTWGATAEEREMPFPCDRHLPDADDACDRGVTVNWGRRSPQELVPGAEHLEAGQRVLSIFRLVAFEPDRYRAAPVADPRLAPAW
jgi:hypothetical protein